MGDSEHQQYTMKDVTKVLQLSDTERKVLAAAQAPKFSWGKKVATQGEEEEEVVDTSFHWVTKFTQCRERNCSWGFVTKIAMAWIALQLHYDFIVALGFGSVSFGRKLMIMLRPRSEDPQYLNGARSFFHPLVWSADDQVRHQAAIGDLRFLSAIVDPRWRPGWNKNIRFVGTLLQELKEKTLGIRVPISAPVSTDSGQADYEIACRLGLFLVTAIGNSQVDVVFHIIATLQMEVNAGFAGSSSSVDDYVAANPALCQAAREGEVQIAKVLLSNGATGVGDDHLLAVAKNRNCAELGELFVTAGGYINTKGGHHALSVAIQLGHESVAKAFIQHGGLDFNRGYFAEHGGNQRPPPPAPAPPVAAAPAAAAPVALGWGAAAAQRRVWGHAGGASWGGGGKIGSDPEFSILFEGIRSGSLDVVRWLVQAGASATVRGRSGMTVLHAVLETPATAVGLPRTAPRSAVAAASSPSKGFGFAPPQDNYDFELEKAQEAMISFLLEHAGASQVVNEKSQQGRSPLLDAASTGNAPAVRLLVAFGAVVDAQVQTATQQMIESKPQCRERYQRVLNNLNAH